MIEQIRKVIKNYFDVNQLMPEHMRSSILFSEDKKTEVVNDAAKHPDKLYRLIFGTDFLDKLVGEDMVCSLCGKFHKTMARFVSACGVLVTYKSLADYHRQQIALLRTPEEIVKYIGVL